MPNRPTIFDAINFPDYKFEEYPKAVKLKDGTSAIANSKSEELKLVAEDSTIPVELAPEGTAKERDELALKLEQSQKDVADANENAAALQKQIDELKAAVAKPVVDPKAKA